METLGSLIDKLTIVELKLCHTKGQKSGLSWQSVQLQDEISEYLRNAVSGAISPGKMVYMPNKVHTGTRKTAIPLFDLAGTISTLATVNCDIWHQQEKIYNFSKLPVDEKDEAIHQIAVLNLQRNDCIHRIDQLFREMVA